MGFCGVFGIWFLLSQGLLCQLCLAGALDPWGIDGLGERLWQLISGGFAQDWTIEFHKTESCNKLMQHQAITEEAYLILESAG